MQMDGGPERELGEHDWTGGGRVCLTGWRRPCVRTADLIQVDLLGLVGVDRLVSVG